MLNWVAICSGLNVRMHQQLCGPLARHYQWLTRVRLLVTDRKWVDKAMSYRHALLEKTVQEHSEKMHRKQEKAV